MIDHDLFWTTGPARVRASVPDPLHGLRGRAYIAARGLGAPALRLDAPDTVERRQARAGLLAAINGGRLTERPAPCLFTSGSSEFLPQPPRRFAIIAPAKPAPAAEAPARAARVQALLAIDRAQQSSSARIEPDRAALEVAHRLLCLTAPLDELLEQPAQRLILENVARGHIKRRQRFDAKKRQANDHD